MLYHILYVYIHTGLLGRAGGVAHATVCFTVGVKRTHAYVASQDMYV